MYTLKKYLRQMSPARAGLISTLLLVTTLLPGSMARAQESKAAEDSPGEGPYLGQEPPGLRPKPFAPGIVNTTGWGDAGRFSLDMKEFHVIRWRLKDGKRETASVTFKQTGTHWQELAMPDRASIPFISPDGKTMYLKSQYRERTAAGWSELKSMGASFEEIRIMSLAASARGMVVFDEIGTNGNGLLRYAQRQDGQWETPKPFGKEINTGTWNAHPYLAPDESYMLWDGERASGYGSSDIYISFRQPDGSWSEAINLGSWVNTEAEEGGPQITPDGKYLFFNRMVKPEAGDGEAQSDLFWVDAQLIDLLKARYLASQKEGQAAATIPAEDTLSFWDFPHLTEAYISTAPADLEDDTPVGELAPGGDRKAMIVQLAREIADHQHGNYDALLIAHKRKLVFESYYKKGRIDLPHGMSSAAKGITSLALGRAIQLGYLSMADLHKPLISFLDSLDLTKLVQGAELITLHKALTMRSGIRLSEEQRKAMEANPDQLRGQGQMQAWLEQSAPITEATQVYAYGSGPELVMQVIEAVVPGGAEQFIKTELLDQLGISNYSWRTGLSGLPEAGWRVSMTARDMLKWGRLILDQGRWQGEQLVPEGYIAKATSAITQPTEDWQPEAYRYGYFWYQTEIEVGDLRYPANMAWGGGGQHIITIEALDLVIAIQGHDRNDAIMTQVANTIVPAFAKEKEARQN